MSSFRSLSRLAAAALILSAVSGPDAWPQTQSIKIVVPFTPGGSADVLARILAEQIGHSQGQTMVVENRPGAGTVVATEAVSRAAPDGATVLINANSFVINPNVKKLTYDPLNDFAPICYLVKSPQVFVVNATSPYRTLDDLLNAARAKPGELTLASVGPATTQQIGFEMLKHAANVNIVHVPYPGNAPAVNALLGEHVTSVFANYSEVVEQLHAGKLRALATASKTRIEPLPDVPSVAESGYKDYEVEVWFGVVAPAKTPKEKLLQLAEWFTAAMQEPAVKAKLVNLGLYPVGICGAQYGAFMRQKYDEYARIIHDANITAE